MNVETQSGSQSRSVPWRALLVATLTVVQIGHGPGVRAEENRPSCIEKLRGVMQAAVDEAPGVRRQLSLLGAEVASVRANAGAGSPVLSWQSEGIDSGFERSANAADYLRLSLPFHRPWHWGTIKDLERSSDVLWQAGQQANRLEVAGLVARRWLDLAAAIELVGVARARVDRLTRASAIQQKRYELGEISGSERNQIELQQAREVAGLESAEALSFALRSELEALIPGGVAAPVADDLQELVASTSSPADARYDELLATSPLLEQSRTAAEVARLEAKHRRGTAWGHPAFEVEWERIPDVGGVEGFDAFGFGLAYPLPIGKQGRQSVLAAEYEAEAAAAEHELLERQLGSRLRSSLKAAQGAEAALSALAPSIVAIASTEHSLTEQFRLGAISYLVYLDGFLRLDEVLRSAIEARHALLVARLDLARILGSELFFPLPDLESEGAS